MPPPTICAERARMRPASEADSRKAVRAGAAADDLCGEGQDAPGIGSRQPEGGAGLDELPVSEPPTAVGAEEGVAMGGGGIVAPAGPQVAWIVGIGVVNAGHEHVGIGDLRTLHGIAQAAHGHTADDRGDRVGGILNGDSMLEARFNNADRGIGAIVAEEDLIGDDAVVANELNGIEGAVGVDIGEGTGYGPLRGCWRGRAGLGRGTSRNRSCCFPRRDRR